MTVAVALTAIGPRRDDRGGGFQEDRGPERDRGGFDRDRGPRREAAPPPGDEAGAATAEDAAPELESAEVAPP